MRKVQKVVSVASDDPAKLTIDCDQLLSVYPDHLKQYINFFLAGLGKGQD